MQTQTINFNNGRQFSISDNGDIKEIIRHKVGNIYRIDLDDYILTRVSKSEFALIGLHDGIVCGNIRGRRELDYCSSFL